MECQVLETQTFTMRGTGNLPKGKEFTLERYLQYEGRIHFLRDSPPACRQHPASNKDLRGSRGIGTWPISELPLMGIPGSCPVDSQILCKTQQVCRNLTTLKEAGYLTN